MAETTTDETEMSRSETADFLRAIADQLAAGDGNIGVPVGNKEIRLSPPDRIDARTTVTERSRRLRKDTEEVSISLKWHPTSDTAESDDSSEEETGPEADS